MVGVVVFQQVSDDRIEQGDLGARYAAMPRSESSFPRTAEAGAVHRASLLPQTPKMPVQVTGTPSLASTAWTWSLQLVRR